MQMRTVNVVMHTHIQSIEANIYASINNIAKLHVRVEIHVVSLWRI